MIPKSKTEFDSYTPEELSELYKKDPHHFDELAEEALSRACIGRTPEETTKHRQMQWVIDAQLRKAKTPLERMHIMENIFYSQVFGDGGELAQLMESCTELIRVAGGAAQVPKKKPALYLVRK